MIRAMLRAKKRVPCGLVVILLGMLACLFVVRQHSNSGSTAVISTSVNQVKPAPQTGSMNSMHVRSGRQVVTFLEVDSALMAGSVDCSLFIDNVRRQLPPERETTKHLLGGLQAALFVNDYIMAARSSNSGAVSIRADAIERAFATMTTDTAFLRNNLATYSSFPESLSEHYLRVSANPAAKGYIEQIQQTLRDNDVAVDPNKDLLLDCLRLVCLNTEITQMYGPKKNPTDDSVSNPQEAAASVRAINEIFAYRFVKHHHLSEAVAQRVLQGLASRSIEGLSPADLEAPVVLR